MEIINFENSKCYEKVLDDKTYWIEMVIHDYEVYDIIQKIPTNILEFIKNGSIYLLVSNQYECFETVPKIIYEFLIIKHQIPENKIVFLSGAKDIASITKTITSNINSQYNTNYKGLDSRFFAWFEYNIAVNLQHKGTRNIDFKRALALEGKKTYSKHFLLLNRRWRIHRPTLVALLVSKNLLDKGYVSLGANDQNLDWDMAYDVIVENNKNNKFITSTLESNKEKILSLNDFTLDTENFENKQIEINPLLDQYYENSFMSIVTETYFYNWNTLFLSEKTFKPIAYKQPFILVSIPYSLQFLKELGYKTFHPFIDESYDLEIDDAKRMEMIVLEIERICNLSDKELKELSLKVKDICNYNYKLLRSKSL
jgi:hypothetical protein